MSSEPGGHKINGGDRLNGADEPNEGKKLPGVAKREGGEKLWGGRFTGNADPEFDKYNESLSFDWIFYAQDVAGSIAWARANTAIGILSSDEFTSIESGLRRVEQEWANGTFQRRAGDEDIHTANERRLGELIGKNVAGKLHTGRSRNDQVVTDMRLWLRDELRKIASCLEDLLGVVVGRAEKEIDYIMPGYTHLQRAQPIRWSHWLLSYGVAFGNDLQRLREVIHRVNRSPLGCGALAGNPFNVDRDAIAKELGFEGLINNSMAAVADRDFALEAMQWASMLMLHLSRWAEDLIIYSTAEFGFVQCADAYTSGSSLMPQKKNPDALELIRGKTGRVFGHMAGLTMSIKGTPSTYNKDLQESVEPVIGTVSTVLDSIRIATGVLSTLSTNPDKMLAALSPDMLATDLADYLVRKGVPFRETHEASGKVVALAERKNVPMDKLDFHELKMVDHRFGEDVMDVWSYKRSVEMRSAKGGTSRSAVLEQIKLLKESLDGR